MISQVGVGPDLLSGLVMKMVDPDVESGDQVLMQLVPDVDEMRVTRRCPSGPPIMFRRGAPRTFHKRAVCFTHRRFPHPHIISVPPPPPSYRWL